MENISKEESKNKIKKTAKTFDNILKVIKILLIILIILSMVSAVIMFLLGATDYCDTIYEKFPTKLGKIEFGDKNDRLMFIDNANNITVKELYLSGDLDKLMYGLAVEQVSYSLTLLVCLLISHFVQKVFRLLHQNESPFDKTLIKPFKILFILLTLFVVFKSVIFGIITGGLLLCLYLIYVYGCRMQEDEDMTLWLS